MGNKEDIKVLKGKLADFIVDYVGAKVQDGITYSLKINDKNNIGKIDELMQLRKELTAAGVAETDVFRVYGVSNGYIFDVDLGTARDLIAKMAKGLAGVDGDLIGNMPNERRDADIKRLAKSIVKAAKNGSKSLEIAMFSRNSVPRITISGKDSAGANKLLTFDAYAVRHWDIDEVNRLTLPHCARVTKIDTHEILPSETGLRVVLHLAYV